MRAYVELAGVVCIIVAAFMVTAALGFLALGVGLIAAANLFERPRRDPAPTPELEQ